MADPEFDYGLVPMQFEKIIGLLSDTKRLPTWPAITRDLFFPELQQLLAR